MLVSRRAITKVQTVIIVAIVAVAAILGGAYWYVSQLEPTEPTGPTIIRFWTDESSPESMVAWGELEHNFEQAYPEYDFIVEYLTFEDIITKLMASVQAGTQPDITKVDFEIVGMLAQENIITPVDDVIDAIGRDNFMYTAITMATVNDKAYVVPQDVMPLAFYIRQDWLDEKGLDAPTTWDEMLNVAAAFTEPEKGRYGWSQDYGDAYGQHWWLSALWQTGYAVFDENGNLAFDNPGTKQAFQFMKDLNQYAPPGAIGDGYYDGYMRFVNGEVGMNWMWGRIISLIEKYNPDISDDVAIIPPPTGPGPKGQSTSQVSGEGYGIPQGAKNVEGAKAFLTWFMSNFDELNKLLRTVPGLLLPSLRTAYDNPKYWAEPTMTKWKDRIIEGELYLVEHGTCVGFEHGTFEEDFSKAFWSEEILIAMQDVLIGTSTVEDAVTDCNAALQAFLQE